jgi:AraC-like DNA-binding protein
LNAAAERSNIDGMTLATIDLALRSGAIALLLLLAALLGRDFSGRTAGRLAALFALGSAIYAVSSAAGATTWPLGWHAPLIALSTGNVLTFWLFTRALFDDDFTLRPWHGLAWGALVAVSLVNCTLIAPMQDASSRWLGVALSLLALGILALAVVQSVRSWSADLVEGRRLLRTFMVGAAAIYSIVATVMQLVLAGSAPPVLVSVVNAAVLLGIAAVIVVAMTRTAGDEIFAAEPVPTAEPQPDATIAAGDQQQIAALNRLMHGERIYRQEGLTIGMLANRLNLPEYRLRRLINQQLGYRNFSAFLNGYRIEEAKAALADPTQADVPVTTIALDAGFQSLGPFNRAFKSITGVTPTEFRRTRLVAG